MNPEEELFYGSLSDEEGPSVLEDEGLVWRLYSYLFLQPRNPVTLEIDHKDGDYLLSKDRSFVLYRSPQITGRGKSDQYVEIKLVTGHDNTGRVVVSLGPRSSLYARDLYHGRSLLYATKAAEAWANDMGGREDYLPVSFEDIMSIVSETLESIESSKRREEGALR